MKYEIEKTVLLATYFPHKESSISNFRLYDWIRDNKRFLMFGSLDFDHFFYQVTAYGFKWQFNNF